MPKRVLRGFGLRAIDTAQSTRELLLISTKNGAGASADPLEL